MSALKIISKENLSERAQKILKNESTIMQTMDHASVISLKRLFENKKFIILEMELIPGGQLGRLFKLQDASGARRFRMRRDDIQETIQDGSKAARFRMRHRRGAKGALNIVRTQCRMRAGPEDSE